MTRPLTPAELAEVAEGLRRLLAVVAAGEMVATPTMTARLEGAWLVARALADGRMPNPADLLGDGG